MSREKISSFVKRVINLGLTNLYGSVNMILLKIGKTVRPFAANLKAIAGCSAFIITIVNSKGHSIYVKY
jgi:hypothetical protein